MLFHREGQIFIVLLVRYSRNKVNEASKWASKKKRYTRKNEATKIKMNKKKSNCVV